MRASVHVWCDCLRARDVRGRIAIDISCLFLPIAASVRTALGRRIQIGKVIGSSSIPFFLFLIIIATIIGLRMQKKQERAKARETLDFSIDISIVVHALQKERDTSVVYAARDGDIGGTLSQDYAGTDKVGTVFLKNRYCCQCL